MLNIIKMDLYRLSKQWSTWIVFLFTILSTVFSIYMINEDLVYIKNDPENAQHVYDDVSQNFSEKSGNRVITAVGIMFNTNPEWANENYKISIIELMILSLNSKLYFLLAGILIILFVRGETKNGYLKTVSGRLPTRRVLAFSKLISSAVYVIAIFIALLLAVTLSSYIFLGYINFGFSLDYIAPMLVQLLLHIGICSVIAAITMITNGTFIPIIILTALAFGLFDMLYSFVTYVLMKISVLSKDFVIFKYLVSGNIPMITENASTDALIRASIVSVVFIIVFATVSMFVYKKRDVK